MAKDDTPSLNALAGISYMRPAIDPAAVDQALAAALHPTSATASPPANAATPLAAIDRALAADTDDFWVEGQSATKRLIKTKSSLILEDESNWI